MNYRIHGASVIGSSHVINNTPCQDACAFKIIAPSYAIIAVADGLGSAIKSDIGARITVDTVVQFAENYFTTHTPEDIDLGDLIRKSIDEARAALENTSLSLQYKLKDIACTLLSIAIANDTMIVAHIGDGAVIYRNDSGLLIASGPGDSEYANEVTPLTANDWRPSLRVSSLITNITDVMVISDGCQRAALKKAPEGLLPFEPFCAPLFTYFRQNDNYDNGIEALKSLLSSNKLCENCDDDKTLVLINIAKQEL